MRSEKKYYSISEVSKMLNIKEHVIRHWDSVDPKTQKLRIQDLSIRTKGGTRFFNRSHIKKLSVLNNILKENGKRNYSLHLASKLISQGTKIKKSRLISENNEFHGSFDKNYEKLQKIRKIQKNLKKLIDLK